MGLTLTVPSPEPDQHQPLVTKIENNHYLGHAAPHVSRFAAEWKWSVLDFVHSSAEQKLSVESAPPAYTPVADSAVILAASC